MQQSHMEDVDIRSSPLAARPGAANGEKDTPPLAAAKNGSGTTEHDGERKAAGSGIAGSSGDGGGGDAEDSDAPGWLQNSLTYFNEDDEAGGAGVVQDANTRHCAALPAI